MNAGMIVIASALAAMACTNPDSRPKDRAMGTGNTATSTATPGAATRDAQAAPDNTGLNERDRQPTVLPLDQGNSAAETDITASIRKGIMADEKLSFSGKNVKVITVGSKVTLRGPVESDQAKVAIASIATRTAGVSEVDNQLEVKN